MESPSLQTTLKVNDEILLELTDEHHAHQLLSLVNVNRQYLREWLPWVDHMQTEENFLQYISRCKKQHEEGTDVGYMILFKNVPAGRLGIHYISSQNRSGAIGYWLAEEFTGKGIITKACIALINYCFDCLALNRIEIKCATGKC